ncbi:MAG: hypothetical protein WDZ35_16160 [Crocinitomicaceae bacterium]
MNNTVKFILVFLGSAIFMFLVFYFYPAEIFDAKVVGKDGGEVATNVSLRAFFGIGELPQHIHAENVVQLKKPLSGWMVVFICLLGLPLMIAYRSTITKKSSPTKE